MLGRNTGIRVAALDYFKHFHFDNKIDLSLIEHSELDKLIKRASVDNLTGLFYRDVLFSFLQAELERANRHCTSVSLLMVDLDGFKEINDTYGHQTGDDVLARAASIIRSNIRSMDMPGRYGGEEFVVIVPDTETLPALHSAERIRKAIENEFRSDINLTVSIGIGCYPADADSMDSLVKAADMALYAAKNNGKNQSCLSYYNNKKNPTEL
jgi:diguanylate cyclase (GGDEF)-like protein